MSGMWLHIEHWGQYYVYHLAPATNICHLHPMSACPANNTSPPYMYIYKGWKVRFTSQKITSRNTLKNILQNILKNTLRNTPLRKPPNYWPAPPKIAHLYMRDKKSILRLFRGEVLWRVKTKPGSPFRPQKTFKPSPVLAGGKMAIWLRQNCAINFWKRDTYFARLKRGLLSSLLFAKILFCWSSPK